MTPALPNPTDAELAILRVLWERGPSTVRQVQETLEQDRPTGYTTALKLLQIMMEKGLVERDASERTHVYWPRRSAFDGSAARLVMQALATRRATPEELDEIRKLLDQHAGRDK